MKESALILISINDRLPIEDASAYERVTKKLDALGGIKVNSHTYLAFADAYKIDKFKVLGSPALSHQRVN